MNRWTFLLLCAAACAGGVPSPPAASGAPDAGSPATPPQASALRIDGPSHAVSGAAMRVQVTAVDQAGNAVAGYAGSPSLAADEAGATVARQQDGSWSVTLLAAGPHTLSARDSRLGGSLAVQVSPGAAARLSLSFPTQPIQWVLADLLVEARDAAGNLTPDYRGVVTIASADASWIGPSRAFTAADQGRLLLKDAVEFDSPGAHSVSTASPPGSATVTVMSWDQSIPAAGPAATHLATCCDALGAPVAFAVAPGGAHGMAVATQTDPATWVQYGVLYVGALDAAHAPAMKSFQPSMVPWDYRFSPDGTRLAVHLVSRDSSVNELWIANADGSSPRRLDALDGPWVWFMGDRIVYKRPGATTGTYSLCASTYGGAVQTLDANVYDAPAAWPTIFPSPDGKRLAWFGSASHLSTVAIDDLSQAHDLGDVGGMGLPGVAWSPDGSKLVWKDLWYGNVWTGNWDGTSKVQIWSSTQVIRRPAPWPADELGFSPDGAVVGFSAQDASYQDTLNLHRFSESGTANDAHVHAPGSYRLGNWRFSADSKDAILDADDGSTYTQRLRSVPVAASGSPEPATVGEDFVGESALGGGLVAWTSPLGLRLAPAAGGGAWTFDADGSTDVAPLFSPDGRWIAYGAYAHGWQRVTVAPADGSAPPRAFMPYLAERRLSYEPPVWIGDALAYDAFGDLYLASVSGSFQSGRLATGVGFWQARGKAIDWVAAGGLYSATVP